MARTLVMLTAALGCLLLAGCGAAHGFKAPAPLASAPEPALSPPLTSAPAGRSIAVNLEPEGIVVDDRSAVIAVAVRGTPPGVDLLDARTGALLRFVPLDGAARHLALAGPGGPLLVANETDDRLDELALPSGRLVASIPVGRQPHDAAAIGGVYAVTDELANTLHLVRAGRVEKVVAAPLQPGGVAADGSAFVVVGVRARVVTAYRPDGAVIARAAAGAGPTHDAAGPDGYVYVADTNGGNLLVYRLTGSSLRLVSAVAAGSHPYGIASDPATGWVYVTLTGTNQVVGLHFSGDRLTARRTWPTGRQPNSVAFDPLADSLVVTATGSNQVEMIPLSPGS